METETIIIVSVFSAAWAVLLVVSLVLCAQVSGLRRRLADMQQNRVRVQKLRINDDKNHAFQNPALSPDEELTQRGYSMYVGDDVESGRGTERYDPPPPRQTGGQFVEELARELDHRQQREDNRQQQQQQQQLQQQQQHQQELFHQQQQLAQQRAPPFLLQSIEENKRRSRLANPVANGNTKTRQSDTNPNFIY